MKVSMNAFSVFWAILTQVCAYLQRVFDGYGTYVWGRRLLWVEAQPTGQTLLPPSQRLEETSGTQQTGPGEQAGPRVWTTGAHQGPWKQPQGRELRHLSSYFTICLPWSRRHLYVCVICPAARQQTTWQGFKSTGLHLFQVSIHRPQTIPGLRRHENWQRPGSINRALLIGLHRQGSIDRALLIGLYRRVLVFIGDSF